MAGVVNAQGVVAADPSIAAITGGSIGTGVTGVVSLLAQSWAAVSCPADTSEDTLATISVPANTLGANGSLRITTHWSFTSSANTKTMRVRFSGAAGATYFQINGTTQQFYTVTTTIANRNATNSQGGNSAFVTAAASAGLQSTSALTSAVDTTATTSVVISGQKALGSETMTLEGYTVEVIH